MATFEYNPKLVSLTIVATKAGLGTHRVRGYADGSMITASRDNPTFSVKSSADGFVDTFSKMPKTAGTLTVVLEESAASNDFLASLAQKDEDDSTGYVSLEMKDGSGNESASSPFARVVQPANIDKGSEAGTREWTFACSGMKLNPRGGKQLTA